MYRTAVMALAVLSASPVVGRERAPPPQRLDTEPDWARVRTSAEGVLKSSLFDPESAQIKWLGGWTWGHVKPFQLWSKRTWGWLGCASMNAKNRMGGYVGADTYYVLITPEGKMLAGRQVEVTSECDQPNSTPLQQAFIDVQSSGSQPTSVADELSKLATLRDKGIITQAEFEAQKVKLLAHH